MLDLESLTWADIRLLEIMDAAELITIREIAAHLGHTRSYVDATMKRCVTMGLVEWMQDKGRLRIYELTRRGDAVLAASRDMRRALQVEP